MHTQLTASRVDVLTYLQNYFVSWVTDVYVHKVMRILTIFVDDFVFICCNFENLCSIVCIYVVLYIFV